MFGNLSPFRKVKVTGRDGLLAKTWNALLELLRLLMPRTKMERWIVALSMLYFYSFYLGFFFFRNDALGYVMMGYDTMSNSFQFYFPYVHCWHLRHPLQAIFSLPWSLVRYVISLFGNDLGWMVYTSTMPIISAFSNLLLFKIQRTEGVSSFISSLMVIMFCGFAHVILLSWQYESFPISMFFLLWFTLYILKSKCDSWQDNVLFALITGITSTNMLKVMSVFLISSRNIREAFMRIIKSVWLFGFLMIIPALQLILSSLKHGDFWGHFITNATNFSFRETETIGALWNNFLCEPLFFHNIGKIFYDEEARNTVGGLCTVMMPYSSNMIIVAIIVIYMTVVASCLLFWRKAIVKFLISYLCVDLFILLVLGYGKNEAQLFCMHWMFCIPISVGMLLEYLKKKFIGRVCILLFTIISLSLLAYNSYAYYHSLLRPYLGNNYQYQLNELRGQAYPQKLTDCKFFLFGMGNREKYVYRDKKLVKIDNDSVILDLTPACKDTIIPDEYKVIAYGKNGDSTVLYENEQAIWIEKNNSQIKLPNSDNYVCLPQFSDKRYGKVLKVLHHEILFNVKNSWIYPNILAYNHVWYRDMAMGAMVLEKTHNVPLIVDALDSINRVYDMQSGEEEGDNIGEYLYLKSLSSHGVTSEDKMKVEKEVNKRTVITEKGKYIKGITDGVENDYYATAWLKFALCHTDNVHDAYSLPSTGGAYKYLSWFTSKPVWYERIKRRVSMLLSNENQGESFFPYLQWAVSHSFKDMMVPVSSSNYPLSWEMCGAKATFDMMRRIAPDAPGHKICFPHIWTAAEMFLYLYTFER